MKTLISKGETMFTFSKTHHFFVVMVAFLIASEAVIALANPVVLVQEIQCDITEPVYLMVVPDGSGMDFSEARTIDGQVVDATIRVQLWLGDEYGPIGPLPGWSAEDISFGAVEDHTQSCTQDYLITGQGLTDSDGWTEITLAPHGGGWTQGILEVFIMADPALIEDPDPSVLSIQFNSPDINGDGLVNLVDVSLFAQDFFSGTAPFRSDLVWDGVLNLSDVGVFAQNLGVGCN